MSRFRGLPFSNFFTHITPWNHCPTRAVLLTATFTCLLVLINIGSTTAFNAILSLTTLGLYFSYGIPILIFAIRRFNRSDPIQFGPWSLGRYGLPLNIVAICFCIFLIIFLPFPSTIPVTAQNMNYSSTVFGGIMIIAIIYYVIRGRKHFVGPIREVESIWSNEMVNNEDAAPGHNQEWTSK